MNASLLLQSVIDGLLMGGIYGLVAIGLTLIFGVMKIINFSQGALMMLGMYCTYWIVTLLGWNPYVALPVSAVALFIVGYALQQFLLEKTLHAPEHNQLLVTMGIMLILENTALVLWKPDYRSVKVPDLANGLLIGDISINKPKLIAFVFSIVLTAILYWFLQKTYTGKAIRGTSQQPDGASLVGIKVKRINSVTFGLGSALAAVAGTLLVPFFDTFPTVGHVFILKAFVVVVLGGLGNFIGALAGGLIVGVSESLGGLLLTGNLKEMVTYLIFIAVLLFRPTGIFKGGTQ